MGRRRYHERVTRARARIDLSAFAHNLQTLRACAPHSQQMAVVKADAYGHGLLPMARAAREAGAEWLGVALFSEALELRAAGDTGPVLAWLATPDDPWAQVIEAGIDVGVSTLAVAVGEESSTVEEVCEPFLVRAGMIARTPRGRVATALAWTHLGLAPPPHAAGFSQAGLFE